MKLCEAIEGIVATVVGAMAVGPFVVADRVDQGIAERGEAGGNLLEPVVGTDRASGLDVADVNGAPDVGILIDRAYERRHEGQGRLRRPRLIRYVADHGVRRRAIV